MRAVENRCDFEIEVLLSREELTEPWGGHVGRSTNWARTGSARQAAARALSACSAPADAGRRGAPRPRETAVARLPPPRRSRRTRSAGPACSPRPPADGAV